MCLRGIKSSPDGSGAFHGALGAFQEFLRGSGGIQGRTRGFHRHSRDFQVILVLKIVPQDFSGITEASGAFQEFPIGSGGIQAKAFQGFYACYRGFQRCSKGIQELTMGFQGVSIVFQEISGSLRKVKEGCSKEFQTLSKNILDDSGGSGRFYRSRDVLGVLGDFISVPGYFRRLTGASPQSNGNLFGTHLKFYGKNLCASETYLKYSLEASWNSREPLRKPSAKLIWLFDKL